MTGRDEDGQALLLALGFLALLGLLVSAILTFADSSLRGTAQLREQRATVYAADGAIDAAIEVGRSNTGIGAYGDPRCLSAVSSGTSPVLLKTKSTTADATVMIVTCAWSPDPLQPDRTVTFTSFAEGTTNPIVRATVLYHDSGGPVPDVNIQSWTYCAHVPGGCP